MDKETTLYAHNGIFFSLKKKKKEILQRVANMDEP